MTRVIVVRHGESEANRAERFAGSWDVDLTDLGKRQAQLVADYLDQFREKLVVEFETYFNGQKMHHDDIARAVADIVEKSIGNAVHNLKISI